MAVYGYNCRTLPESGESCLSTAIDTFSVGDWIVVLGVVGTFLLVALLFFIPASKKPANDASPPDGTPPVTRELPVSPGNSRRSQIPPSTGDDR